jgi:eukaryotic-like serine/threonine-protein kinase
LFVARISGHVLAGTLPDRAALAEPQVLTAGACLGPYEIRQAIGAGGMGEVYRAWDRRLARDVAIKVLPACLGEDPAALLRFEREARAIAALSHPNVLAIHDIGEHEGGAYVITEFLDGMTLRSRLQQGPLSLEQTLGYARQIAAGLEAAHAKGIVHRDIKPENLFLTRQGTVKILDFGLARQTKPPTPEDVTVSLPTPPGSVTGTVGYISPEQVRGMPADARSDIFSFGCVLYEMLRGAPPFRRRTSVETLMAILREDPEPLNGEVPASILSIVTRCLAKNPESRFNTAADLAFVLEALPDPVSSSRSGKSIVRANRGAVLSVVAAVVLLTVVMFAWQSSDSADSPNDPAAPAPLSPMFTHLTSEGAESSPSLSPDGRWFVYVSGRSGNADIYLQAVGGQLPINLTADSPANDWQPAYSHDGERIVFRSERDGGGLFIMGRTGEGVRRIARTGYNPSWSPDAREVVFGTGAANRGLLTLGRAELMAVTVATGTARIIDTPGDALQPSWSPRGHRIAYWTTFDGIWTVPARSGTGDAVRVTDFLGWNPVWSRGGDHLYFVSERGGSMNLWRIAIDEVSGRPIGAPQQVTVPSPYVGDLSYAAAADRLIFSSYVIARNIEQIAFDSDRGGPQGEPRAVTRGSRSWGVHEPSRDGRWVAIVTEVANRCGGGTMFIARADGSDLRQVTIDGFRGVGGVSWSPDSRRIAVNGTFDETGQHGIWTIGADGSDVRLVRHEAFHPLWSPDGLRVSFHGLAGELTGIFDLTRPEGPDNPEFLPALTTGGTTFDAWSWSPDGQFLSGNSLEAIGSGEHSGIVLYSLDSGTYERLTDFGSQPSWSPDGRWIVFAHEGRLFSVDRHAGATGEFLTLGPDILSEPKFSSDGRQVYFSRRVGGGDIWLASLDGAGAR